MWVSDNKDDLVESLTRQQKNELASIVNSIVLFDGKKMKMRNAVDRYISSLTTAVTRLDPSFLKLPEMIRRDIYNEEDD